MTTGRLGRARRRHDGGRVIDLLLGGTVFLINEEDEAEEYSQIHRDGSARYHQLFSAPDRVAPGQEKLVALFDEQVHDSAPGS